MTPGKYDLDLYRGDTYTWRFRVWEDEAKTQPADLTGVTAKAEVREKPGGTTIMDLACTIEVPNVVRVRLDETDWDSWTLGAGVWDLQLTYPSVPPDVVTIAAGSVKVTADVTDSTLITARRR